MILINNSCYKFLQGNMIMSFSQLGYPDADRGFTSSKYKISQVHTLYFVAITKASPRCLPQNLM